jgi:hypothetical protein
MNVKIPNQSIAVIYIARGIDAGFPAFNTFINSYVKYASGIEHTLYIAAKGWKESEIAKVRNLCDSINARLILTSDDGFDWGVYLRLVPELNEKWVCMLNSHSTIRSLDWLAKLYEAASQPDIGAAGATGSYSTWAFRNPFWGFNFECIFQYPVRILQQLVKQIKYGKNYNFFPNYHLRSNAFIIRRSLFVEFSQGVGVPSSKSDSHKLESGKEGLSSFLLQKGLNLLVCGANRVNYPPNDWAISNTFRVPGQANLLVEDNQTRMYERAHKSLKLRLEYASWGKAAH